MFKIKKDPFEEYFLKKLGPGVQIATLGSIFLLVTGFFLKYVKSVYVGLSMYIASMLILVSAMTYFILIIFTPKNKRAHDILKFFIVSLFIGGIVYFVIATSVLMITGWSNIIRGVMETIK